MRKLKATYYHPLSKKFLGSSEQDRPYDERGWRLLRENIKIDLDFHHKRIQKKDGMLPRPILELLGLKRQR